MALRAYLLKAVVKTTKNYVAENAPKVQTCHFGHLHIQKNNIYFIIFQNQSHPKRL